MRRIKTSNSASHHPVVDSFPVTEVHQMLNSDFVQYSCECGIVNCILNARSTNIDDVTHFLGLHLMCKTKSMLYYSKKK